MRKGSADQMPSGASIGPKDRWLPNSALRHGSEGEIYGHSTIRTVTPEHMTDDARNARTRLAPEGYNSYPSPTSPHGSSQESPPTNSRSHRLRAGSSNELAAPVVSRDQQSQALRPRTRTLDSNAIARETSPPTGYSRNRTRMGSANSMSAPLTAGVEDVVTSIGHPSTIPQPSFTTAKRRGDSSKKLGKVNHTLRDPPIQENSPPSTQPSGSHTVKVEPRLDMRKILKLMKSSCGKMEGQLAFRRFETIPWSLSYCSINDETGSLVYEPKASEQYYRTLIPDLRGCHFKTSWDAESQMLYLDVCPQNSRLRVHLRPHTQDEFDSWYAALLCWQPIRPKGAQNRMTKPQISQVTERKLSETRRHSEVSLHKDPPVIKFGKMIFHETVINVVPSSSKSSKSSRKEQVMRKWQPVSCQLRENGEMTLHSEQDMSLITKIQLSHLCRSAVQRLDSSVLEAEFSIAIYPQYAASSTKEIPAKPIYLALESRVVFEAWLVLLRAFTVPQLYGPKDALNQRKDVTGSAPSTTDMFRMERSLQVNVLDARLAQPMSPRAEHPPQVRSDSITQKSSSGHYVEVLLDGEVRARTVIKPEETSSLFWREDFHLMDLPAALSVASLVLRKRLQMSQKSPRTPKEEPKKLQPIINGSATPGTSGILEDEIHGVVDIFLDDLEAGKVVEKWWPLINHYGQNVGEILVKVQAEESVILMAEDYRTMSDLLHRFANSLTLQIAQRMPELNRLSGCLLNIFQVSGSATEWINSLVEEEIDGTLNKEVPITRVRYPTRRMSANETGEVPSYSPRYDRELMLRDRGKSATVEANLLFRGNSLLTKSLDGHMKRVGKDYLEETIADKLREIASKDPDCEVDPNRIADRNEMDRNWRKLLHYTETLWKLISNSAHRCPSELRYIFRHIRACADDRYGDFLRTVSYSSVSGFLFLRFFVPAILNPTLFGIFKDHPPPNTRRTFTLIAKSLQGLANMTTFGAKEEWMEAMNSFLSANRNNFKNFIDTICDVPSDHVQVTIPPAYSTPLAILQRLPPTSQEGFPSLPHLIDHAKSFATLVNLWLENCAHAAMPEHDNDLTRFHQQCLMLRQRTEDSLARAERAEKPSSRNSIMYEELIDQMETGSSTAATIGGDSPSYTRLGLSAAGHSIERPGTSVPALHSRGDSFGAKPSIGSRSTSGGPDSPLTMRGWKGPSRQLSLEILPSARVMVNAKDTLSAKPQIQASYDQLSQNSYSTSQYGGSDSAPDVEDIGRRSGRTTPSQFMRNADPRVHPFVPGYGMNLPMGRDIPVRTGSRDKGHKHEKSHRTVESKNGGSDTNRAPTSDKSRTSSRSSNPVPPESRGNDIDSTTYTGNAGWTGEKVFKSSSHRGKPPRELSSRHLLRERAEQLEPGESSPDYPLRPQPSSSTNTTPRPSSSKHSQRIPRRDWTPDERAKRDERTHGIVVAGTSRSRAIFTGSAENSSGEEAFHADDRPSMEDEGTTALPQFTPQQQAQIIAQAHEKVASQQMQREGSRERGDKERLLERMKWKKRK